MLVTDLKELRRIRPAILTIGAFDGVHRGHQFLIREVVERAHRLDYDAIVLTFDPRPEVVLRPDNVQLTDGESKASIIAALGPDIVVVMPFSREVAGTSPEQFLALILDHINLQEVWIGADFAFGYKRQGNVDFLQRSGEQHGFAVEVVSRQPLDGTPISSTLVRELVQSGRVGDASRFLGHFYGWSGRVVTGLGRGRQLGYPTANMEPPHHQILPATGIYAAYAEVGGRRLQAAVSVGYNVHFEEKLLKVEAYMLDFDGELVNQMVRLEFVARLREEERFDSLEDLIAQMGRDVKRVREILAAVEAQKELIPGE